MNFDDRDKHDFPLLRHPLDAEGAFTPQALIEAVRAQPKPEARVVTFFSFGEALYGGPYYDTQSLENVLMAQCLLASRMNGQRLPQMYGAPPAAMRREPAWL